jgi:hypothetical protein
MKTAKLEFEVALDDTADDTTVITNAATAIASVVGVEQVIHAEVVYEAL